MSENCIIKTKKGFFVKIDRDSNIPLIGNIAFGLIDRGTNIIQVRPTSFCALSCIFCSTDAGPKSKHRQTEYMVSRDYLIEEITKLVRFKGPKRIEAHIDTVGDPFTFPEIVELVQDLSEIEGIEVISIQTHGVLLNERLTEELDEAGLSRINLSIDSMDPEKAKKLSGTFTYKLSRILSIAEYIAKNTNIDLLLAPVWVPGINNDDIPKIIEFALEIGAGKKWPPLGIQKYERHRRGRKPKGIRPMTWKQFYRQLRTWEKIYDVKLVLRKEDFDIHKRKAYPCPFKVGQTIKTKISAPGWLWGEYIGVSKGFAITVISKDELEIGIEVFVKIIKTKHNIILAKLI